LFEQAARRKLRAAFFPLFTFLAASGRATFSATGGSCMRARGFTLVEILIVVGIVGLLAVLAIPSFMKSREKSQAKTCMNNLRQIYYAKEHFASQNSLNAGDPVTENDVAVFLNHGLPVCPAGGAYSVNPVGSDPSCTVAGHICP